ncbi:PAS domain-containing protein [Halorientalis pallida]|uniref:histidine kinase n=1 Tax=Halorientalis pallida TaxID=2479928 RepID=A0A498KR32_9EURY|nr:PAS domain-containing sensor histidine kinase [Halorientalis pallida]RXK46436.1 PAS domain-containing sensor histidine kinase [Halorientalis pallida]
MTSDAGFTHGVTTDDEARIRLLVADRRNRELLSDWLAEAYRGQVGTDPDGGFDLCVLDAASFARHREWLRERKEGAHPVFLPALLVSNEPPSEELDPSAWSSIDGLYVIDEIVSVPVEKSVLYRRLENLLERRRLSQRLSGRLERSRERFRTLFDGTPDPVFVLSTDSTIQYVNDAFCEQFDLTRETALDGSLGDLSAFPTETATTVEGEVATMLDGRETGPETVTYRGPDGTERFAEITVNSIDAGDRDDAVVIMRDVTERRKRERELEESETRFRAVFENAHDGLLIANDDGRCFDANPAAADLLGVDRDELIGMSIADFAPPDFDFEAAWQRFQESDRQRGEFPLVRADGEERVVEFSATTDILPGRHLSALRDVTERKEMEAQLRESEQRFNQIADSVHEVIWMTDPTTDELVYLSPGFGELVDRSGPAVGDDPVGFLDAVHPDDRRRVRDWMLTVHDPDDDADSYSIEHRIQRPDGTVRWVETDAYPVRDEDGVTRRYVGIIDDITELKARERELTAQNERLDRFATLVSHDLRNPLQVAVSRVDAARTVADPDGEVDDHLDTTAGSLDRMDRLIDDVLTLAREGQSDTDPEPVALSTASDRAWECVERTDATLTVAEDARIRADPDRIVTLLENFFRNAVEHAGGPVSVTVGALESGFYVADDGPGIPEDERDVVTELGYSTSDDGTGFGLAIVREIAKAHGWELTVTESDEGGARFEFTGVGRLD